MYLNAHYSYNVTYNNLREFALHTTVILAQPRVPRLRAAANYVASGASVGPCLGIRGRTVDRYLRIVEFLAGTPLLSYSTVGGSYKKNSKRAQRPRQIW